MVLEYNLKLSESKAQVEGVLKQIESQQKKNQKHFKNLVATLQKTEEKAEHKNCVWLCEMRYISSANLLSDVQLKFAAIIKAVLEDAIKLESRRISCVKRAMQEYMNLHADVFRFDVSETLEVLEEVDEGNFECLEDSRLFRPEEIEGLRALGIRERVVEELACWRPEGVCEFEWVMKEGAILMESGVFQQWQECYGIIVKSRFLHIFAQKPEFPFVEPIESVYLVNAKLMVSQSTELFVEISECNKTGILGKLVTGKQVVIKTKDADILTEWMETIQALR